MRGVLALIAAALLVGASAISVQAAPSPRVTLSFTLYEGGDTPVVDYEAQRQGGNQDLAVVHECVDANGSTVQSRINRLYWSGPGKKLGTWNLNVQAGTTCTAVVVDLNTTGTGVAATSTTADSSYESVSNTVSYVVE